MRDFVNAADAVMERLADLFQVIANLCLLAMLVMTATTILLRPFDYSIYWLWPWSMQVFVWMAFFGFFAVYRRKKDIAVDFIMRKIGVGAMVFSRYFASAMILVVTGVMLWEMPKLLATQVGVIDGVITPWGWELERFTLTWPLALSCALIFLNSTLEVAKALLGEPEEIAEHSHLPDS